MLFRPFQQQILTLSIIPWPIFTFGQPKTMKFCLQSTATYLTQPFPTCCFLPWAFLKSAVLQLLLLPVSASSLSPPTRQVVATRIAFPAGAVELVRCHFRWTTPGLFQQTTCSTRDESEWSTVASLGHAVDGFGWCKGRGIRTASANGCWCYTKCLQFIDGSCQNVVAINSVRPTQSFANSGIAFWSPNLPAGHRLVKS